VSVEADLICSGLSLNSLLSCFLSFLPHSMVALAQTKLFSLALIISAPVATLFSFLFADSWLSLSLRWVLIVCLYILRLHFLLLFDSPLFVSGGFYSSYLICTRIFPNLYPSLPFLPSLGFIHGFLLRLLLCMRPSHSLAHFAFSLVVLL